jgi:site-specific recombinase XerD
LVEEYLDFRATHQGVSQHTLAKQARCIRKYLSWQFGQHPCDWSRVTVSDIWRYSELSSRGYRPSVANDRLSTFRSFLRFIYMRGACHADLGNAVMHRASYGFQVRAPQVLTEAQRTLFIASFDREQREGCRDYAMALCMVDLGLRSSEVVLLKLADLDWEHSTIRVPGVKSHHPRELPLMPRLRDALRDYIEHFRPTGTEPTVFLRHPRFVGTPINRNAVAHAMRNAYRRCHFPSSWSGTHRLRHTFATRLYASGAPVKELADLLGHRSLDSTQRYTHLDLEGLRQLAQPWPT